MSLFRATIGEHDGWMKGNILCLLKMMDVDVNKKVLFIAM